MKHYMYSIYDSVALVYNKPFGEINDGTATRAFNQAMEKNPNPQDFHLYKIGEYNDSDGVMISIAPIKLNTNSQE